MFLAELIRYIQSKAAGNLQVSAALPGRQLYWVLFCPGIGHMFFKQVIEAELRHLLLGTGGEYFEQFTATKDLNLRIRLSVEATEKLLWDTPFGELVLNLGKEGFEALGRIDKHSLQENLAAIRGEKDENVENQRKLTI
jgi:hypothetical protein